MHIICHIDDIQEGSSRGFNVNGIAIFGVKKEGHLYFYKNQCPHLGAEMEWMNNEFLDEHGQRIRCQFHGALFKIESGDCISGPCKGDSLAAIETIVRDSVIYLV